MTCKFCGNEIPDGSDVCYVCGQSVAEEGGSAPASQNDEVYAQQPEDVAAEALYDENQPVQNDNYVDPASQPVASKSGKIKNPNKVGGFLLFICALFPLIGALVYLKNKNIPERKVSIANATFIGLNIKLFIIIIICVFKFMI